MVMKASLSPFTGNQKACIASFSILINQGGAEFSVDSVLNAVVSMLWYGPIFISYVRFRVGRVLFS